MTHKPLQSRVPGRHSRRRTGEVRHPTPHPFALMQRLLGNRATRWLVRAKLEIGAPGDSYEREADRVANEIHRTRPAPCDCGGTCSTCRDRIRRQPRRAEPLRGAAPRELPALGPGRVLTQATRSFFEPRFDRDLGRVRVHTGLWAASAAQAIQARAFTAGHHVVFGAGEYAPGSVLGRRLLAHELTHVVQQTGAGSPLVRLASPPRIARTELDLPRLDRELFWGDPLTQTSGRIGYGATRGLRLDTPTEDRRPAMEIHAHVYPRNTASPHRLPPLRGAGSAAPSGSAPSSASPRTAGGEQARSEAPPHPTPRHLLPPANRSRWSLTRSGLLAPARRALVVAGIHGNERGPQDLVRQLQVRLADGTDPLARDFDTVVIPVMNPGGEADRTRTNRRRVDLNRNFPGLTSFPQPPRGTRAPLRQPEVQAVMNVVNHLRPARILALHAVSSPSSAGAFADPVEGSSASGVARELACRMALRMRGQPLRRGGGDVNVRGNELASGVCSARYPGSASVSVTTEQSSLGAWASAPENIGGAGDIPVITHEVSGKSQLAATGRGRSVETIMPGIREFLLDNEHQPSEADAILRRAASEAFLVGRGTTRADHHLRAAVVRIVRRRFADMNAFYRAVWWPRVQPASARARLPRSLGIASHFRSFHQQAGIAGRALRRQPLFRPGGTDTEIAQAIRNVMRTISVPGFSRHPWGTEIDVVSTTRTRWVGSGDLVPLIPFLRDESQRFGFFHPYTQTPPVPSLPHYEDEPWHISYWPIANVLQQQWEQRITKNVLTNLITETAKAIHGPIPVADMQRILMSIGLPHFQSNVARSP